MDPGPQINVPVGTYSSNTDPATGWNGLSIKEILEKVDLFNVRVEESSDEISKEKVLVGKTMLEPNKVSKNMVVSSNNPEDAFLGPKLWEKSISLPLVEESEFSIMNMEDFLNENNLSLDENEEQLEDDTEQNCGNHLKSRTSSEHSNDSNPELMVTATLDEVQSASPPTTQETVPNTSTEPCNGFLYAESKRAKLQREREERKRRANQMLDIEFAPEDLALATIPGSKFNPRERAFSKDELKPQPIIRKRKKQYVPSDNKDEKYWQKRIKNNVAARRSREARRLKENQIALRAAFLERENMALKLQLESMENKNKSLILETNTLRQKLSQYEA